LQVYSKWQEATRDGSRPGLSSLVVGDDAGSSWPWALVTSWAWPTLAYLRQMDEQPNLPASETSLTEAAANDLTGMTPDEVESVETVSNQAVSNQIDESAASEAASPDAGAASAGRTPKKIERAFRVKLRGAVLVLVRLPNKRDVRAAFHQLSVTGGVVHIDKPLDEKLGVEMIFHISGETIREKAQMLFPMWATQGWMQPFRFVDMSEANRASLDAHLKTFLGESAKGASAGA
jgi:hypothetical protein